LDDEQSYVFLNGTNNTWLWKWFATLWFHGVVMSFDHGVGLITMLVVLVWSWCCYIKVRGWFTTNNPKL
jgi:hypothetical protein